MVEAERVAEALADRLAGAVGRHADLLTRAGRRLGGTVREGRAGLGGARGGIPAPRGPARAVRWVVALDGPSRPSHGAVRASLAAVVRRLARTGLPVVADATARCSAGRSWRWGATATLPTETGVLTVPPRGAGRRLRVDALSAGWDE